MSITSLKALQRPPLRSPFPRAHHGCSRRHSGTCTAKPLTSLHATRVTSVSTPHTPDPTPPLPSTSPIPPFILGALAAAAILLGIQKLQAGSTQAAGSEAVSPAAVAVSQRAPARPTTKEAFQQYSNRTPAFSMAGTQCWGRLVDVYDGDTVKIVLPLGPEPGARMYKFSVRMFGIDTSEMKSKVAANRERAIAARNRVVELGLGGGVPLPAIQTKKDIVKVLDENVSLVWVECLEFDKYGRLLAKVFSAPGQAKSFSQVLLDEKLAYEYFGETKLTELEQEGALA